MIEVFIATLAVAFLLCVAFVCGVFLAKQLVDPKKPGNI